MPATLVPLTTALSLDPGLRAGVSATDLQAGLRAADQMNAQILQIIAAAGLNADGRITAEDMQVIATRVQADPSLYAGFLAAHGDDEGNIETGFHLLQNDGGTLMFRGRKFVDTVADAIYHYGFDIIDGRFVNEDGNANELARDVAGWLNFFLNGVSAVYGTDLAETLHSGTYSDEFAAARNEAFYGGGGNDSIWADLGNDTVLGGFGNDVSGGGAGWTCCAARPGRTRFTAMPATIPFWVAMATTCWAAAAMPTRSRAKPATTSFTAKWATMPWPAVWAMTRSAVATGTTMPGARPAMTCCMATLATTRFWATTASIPLAVAPGWT